MSGKKIIYAVSKTHWDREWYLDFQDFRVRLVTLMDHLLDILRDDPDYVSFMMDGQMIPLEDYLSIKPHRFEEIKRYVQEGRIVIGPWYVLPDEVLISGESHIRNWLMGERLSRRFGPKMNIGYLPDSFGHPSQMPQILSGLGMRWMTFWRGATAEVERNEFHWQSPDGSRVLVNLMPIGYSTGAQFPDDADVLARRLDKYIEDFTPISSTDILYMSNGGDHLEALPYLSKVIEGANQRMQRGGIRHTTLEQFFTDLTAELDRDSLKTIEGEMMGTHTAILLTSTLSTRMYLKQANFAAQTSLENVLEPIHTLAALRGYPYPKDILLEAWRQFLQNLPHDSICGCSIDDVHRDMLYRYRQVEEIGHALLDRCGSFYNGISSRGLQGRDGVAVFNTTGRARSDVVHAVVDLEPTLMGKLEFNDVDIKVGGDSKAVRKTTLHDMFGRRVPTAVRAFDGEREVPCALRSAEVFTGKLKLNPYTFPNQYCTLRCGITLLAEDVPPMGYKTLTFLPVYDEQKPAAQTAQPVIENEYFRVTAAGEDGSLTVLDKENGVEYHGLNRLVDSGDCGDEYTYCPPEQDSYVFADPASIRAQVTHSNPVYQTLEITGCMHLPETVLEISKRRSGRLLDCAFTSRVTIYPGIRRIDVETDFHNRAEYHRLRVLFPVGLPAETSSSAGAFSVDTRPVVKPVDPNWQEDFTTNPQKEFCDVSGADRGLTIANRGLPEYEAYNEENQTVIAVTLLRCVGEISKWTMKTRKDRGGWLVFAPEGQCKGDHTFQYAIIPHSGGWEASGSYRTARDFALPLHPLPVSPSEQGELPAQDSFLSLPAGLEVTAFKPCEFEDGYILRFYNTTSQKVSGEVELRFPVERALLADLAEQSLEELPLRQGKIPLVVMPWKVVTIKLLPPERKLGQ